MSQRAPWTGARRWSLFLAILGGMVTCASNAMPAAATEIVVQNDSIPTPTSGTPLPNFLANEIAASWLTTPVAGDLVGVQVLWDSLIGANFPSQELAIHIYASGTFPTPGANLATVVGPVLSDGVINEFRFLDPPTNSVPLNLPVSAGQTFVVGVEFLNQSSGNPIASSVVFDSDGCQSGHNSVFVNPPSGTWLDACPQGVTGDFGIRAIIQPVPEPATVALLVCGLFLLPRFSRLRRVAS